MAGRRMGLMALLLAVCLFLMPCGALAASTDQARDSLDPERECDLTISYRYDGQPFPGETVMLYHIAHVSEDARYSLVPELEATGLNINGIQTKGEWNVIRATLEAYILANDIQPLEMAVTDEEGQVSFTGLEPGLYLASAVKILREDLSCVFAPALIALPGLDGEGLWQYQIAVAAKPEILPPVVPDEEISFKVLKLWKENGTSENRPQTISVEIFRDGISLETVILSQENQWSYSWTAPNDGAVWTVMERNVPHGYTMTLEQREAVFVVTNTWTPEEPDGPKPPPQTGDTAHVLMYTVLMYVSGGLLILLGLYGRRLGHEETT